MRELHRWASVSYGYAQAGYRAYLLFSVSVVLLSRLFLNLCLDNNYTSAGVYNSGMTGALAAHRYLGNLTVEIREDDEDDNCDYGENFEMSERS